jgi:hypothetical protein
VEGCWALMQVTSQRRIDGARGGYERLIAIIRAVWLEFALWCVEV